MHKGKLLSGVPFEVRELTGKHERLLTEDNKKAWLDRMDELLISLLVSVGDYTFGSSDKEDKAFLAEMYLEDKKKALVEARQYSLDFETMFKFMYDYTSEKGNKESQVFEIPLPDGVFPEKLPHVLNEEGELVTMESQALLLAGKTNWEDLTYNDVLIFKEYKITLPKSKKEVTIQRPDGKSELRMNGEKKSARSSHSPLKLRNPRHDLGGTLIQLNLDNVGMRDLAFLREEFRKYEGRVDTEIQFEHPEAETKSPEERMVTQDVMNSTAFFFPSGVR